VIRFGDTQAVGGYEIFLGSEESPVAAFAVQLDPPESDLRPLDLTELASLSQVPEKVKNDAAQRLIVTKEFWPLLIAVVAALAVVEMGLAFRFSRTR